MKLVDNNNPPEEEKEEINIDDLIEGSLGEIHGILNMLEIDYNVHPLVILGILDELRLTRFIISSIRRQEAET